MRYLISIFALAALALSGCTPDAFADVPAPGNPTSVLQTGVNNQAGSTCVNAQAAAGSVTTLTINACPSGQYQYFTYIELDLISNAAATTAGNYPWTTGTSFGSIQFAQSITATAGTMAPPIIINSPNGVKSGTAATSVVFTGATSATNLIEAARACYYCAP